MKPTTLAFALVAFAVTHIALTAINGRGKRMQMSPRLSGKTITAAQSAILAELLDNRRHLRPDPALQEIQEKLESQQQQSQSQSSSQRTSPCSCSPRSFSITLDLSHDCNEDTVKKNSGTVFICSIEVFDNLGNRVIGGDPVPTVITSVMLIEINSVGTVINVDDQYTNVDFRSGSSFDLESISRRLKRGTDIEERADYVPTMAVLFMIGQNDHEEDQEVIATFVWIYSNSCDGVTLNDSDVYSWNVWSGVEEQYADFCPANASEPPSGAPTVSLQPTSSSMPTSTPTASPSFVPSLEPSDRPSPRPSAAPSDRPSYPPSYTPTATPSWEPTTSPSSAPSERSSDAPSGRPSSLPNDEPSDTPLIVQSRADVVGESDTVNGGREMASPSSICLSLMLCLLAFIT